MKLTEKIREKICVTIRQKKSKPKCFHRKRLEVQKNSYKKEEKESKNI